MNGTAACGDHSGWKWPLGENPRGCRETTGMRRAAKTWRKSVRNRWQDGHQISDRVCLFHGELEPAQRMRWMH